MVLVAEAAAVEAAAAPAAPAALAAALTSLAAAAAEASSAHLHSLRTRLHPRKMEYDVTFLVFFVIEILVNIKERKFTTNFQI